MMKSHAVLENDKNQYWLKRKIWYSTEWKEQIRKKHIWYYPFKNYIVYICIKDQKEKYQHISSGYY